MKEQERDRFLDPDDVTNITDENKRYLMDRGYRPFLTNRGKIKWILPSQKGYRVLHGTGIDMMRPPSFRRFLSRHHRLFIVIGVVVVVLVLGLITMRNFL